MVILHVFGVLQVMDYILCFICLRFCSYIWNCANIVHCNQWYQPFVI